MSSSFFPLKFCKSINLINFFNQNLTSHYGSSYCEIFNEFFTLLNKQREDLKYEEVFKQNDEIDKNEETIILNYLNNVYPILDFLKMEKNEKDELSNPFIWNECFQSENFIQIPSLKFEISNHLFNLSIVLLNQGNLLNLF